MYRLGVDLGGTNIAVAVVDENYNIVGRAKTKTDAHRPASEICDSIASTAKEAIKAAGLNIEDIVSAGIGTPGSVIPSEGIVTYANNFACFSNLPLCSMLKERLGIDFYIDNDANAAAYGEYLAGAGVGTKDFIAVTLGTGVGGGIIIDGKMLLGSNFAGGELGHTVLHLDGEQCTCGRKGCFEAYASATALIRQTKRAMEENKDSLMWKLSADAGKVNGRTAFDAMRKGDKAATEVVNQYIRYVAEGVCNIMNIFQPDLLCIGGGISNEKENLTGPVNKIVRENIYTKATETHDRICVAKLGNDAGIIGAAFLDKLYK